MVTVAEAFVTLRPDLGKFGGETEQQLKGATGALNNFGKQASTELDGAAKKAGGFGDAMKGVGTIASGFLAANVVQSGIGAVTGFIGDSIAAIKDSIQVNAQLEAVLKSTGGAAGVTAEHVAGLAGSIEKQSLFEDEAILKGQNLLLTFTNIGNAADGSSHIFDDTTKIMVDMAQAMGTDASGAAIQLGKALNDPTNGISALSRVGVSFTDQQKEQIKTMQEAGDIAGAQTIILNELNKEFGGSAKAASDAAGASEAYKDRMNDLQEEIGSKMLPVNEALMKAKLALVEILATKVVPIISELVEKHWPGMKQAIQQVVAFIQENWPKIQPIFEFAAEFIKTRIEGMIQTVKGIVQVISGVIALVDDLIHGRWSEAWEDLKQIVEGVLNILIGTIKQQFGNIPEIILGVIGSALGAATDLANNIARGILDIIEALPGQVADWIGKIPGAIAGLAGSLYDAGAGIARSLINGLRDALRNFSFRLEIGRQEVAGVEVFPGISTTLRPFSFLKNGLGFVPWDNFAAMLHQGEAVIPADQNPFNPANQNAANTLLGGSGVSLNFNAPVTIAAATREEAEESAGFFAWGLVSAMRVRG